MNFQVVIKNMLDNFKIIFLIHLVIVFVLVMVIPVKAQQQLPIGTGTQVPAGSGSQFPVGSGSQVPVGTGPQIGWGIQNPLRAESFTELFKNITNWIAGIAATLAVLMVVIGGFQYMISGGNEEKTKAALRTIKWALIGLVIILMSWGLISEVLTILMVK